MGHIMIIRPMAIARGVVDRLSVQAHLTIELYSRTETLSNRTVSKASWTLGTNSPMTTPIIMTSTISGVSKRSSMPSFLKRTTTECWRQYARPEQNTRLGELRPEQSHLPFHLVEIFLHCFPHSKLGWRTPFTKRWYGELCNPII